MILTHNYYIDFLKAFNLFLLKVFNSDINRGDGTLAVSKQSIQKITYNIGSKTILTHKLYGNENFEYPNIYIDLADIRASEENIATIARNAYGFIQSPFTAFPCANFTKDQKIFVDTKRYLLNFSVQINVENQADLLNFYHTITNYYPLNYTFIDYNFDYLVDITELVKDWDIENDDIYNLLIANYQSLSRISEEPNIDEKRYFTAINVQPEIEFTSITKQEDLENMKFSLNLQVLTAAQIPFIIYSSGYEYLENIIINIDFNNPYEYPIFFDTANEFKDQNIILGIQIKDFILDDNEIIISLINDIPENYLNSDYSFYIKIQNELGSLLNLPLDKNYKKESEYIKSINEIIITSEDEKYEILKQILVNNDIEKLITFSQMFILK